MSERDYDYKSRSNIDLEKFEEWKKAIQLTGIPDNYESQFAFNTIKVCIPCEANKIKFKDDILYNNGYVHFDYTIYCYFLLRFKLCDEFEDDFVELYDAYIQKLMALYFEHFYNITEEQIISLLKSRLKEYERVVKLELNKKIPTEEITRELLESLCVFIERDLNNIPESDCIIIGSIFNHFDLLVCLIANVKITLNTLAIQVEYIKHKITSQTQPDIQVKENYEQQPQQQVCEHEKQIQKSQKTPKENTHKMKKVLIWIGCFFALVLINVFLSTQNIKFGSIPSLAILFILPQYLCKKLDIETVKKEAYSKGMSIRQYVESVIPSYLIDFCEEHKGETSLIKENVKRVEEECIEAGESIPKRFWVVLLEMYK